MVEDGSPIAPNKQELEERRGRKNLALEEKEKRERGRLNDIKRRERSRERKKKLKNWQKQGNRKQMFESDSGSETESIETASKERAGKTSSHHVQKKTESISEEKAKEARTIAKEVPKDPAGEKQVVAVSQVNRTREPAGGSVGGEGGGAVGVGGGGGLQEMKDFAGETQVVSGFPGGNILGSEILSQDPSTQEFHLAVEVCVCVFPSSFVCCLFIICLSLFVCNQKTFRPML